MPWRESCVMDQKIAFISAALRDEAPISEFLPDGRCPSDCLTHALVVALMRCL